MNHYLLALLIASSLTAGAAAPNRPNVILVMADDQGWGDTRYNGHPELKTPNLDDLAKSGLRIAAQEPERVGQMTATLSALKDSVDKSLSSADYASSSKAN